VGIIAAQSIGEPGTQLTMRTFHTGGVAAGVFKQPQIKSKHDGTAKYNELRSVELEDGNSIVLNKNGSIAILAEDGRELETHTIVIGAVVSVKDGGKVKKGDTFVQWDPHNVPILSEKAGKVKFHDIIEGVTMKQEVDDATGEESMVVIDHKEDLHPQMIISDDKGDVVANYPIPSGAHIVVGEGEKIVPGTLIAKTPRKQAKTRDITGGLPRVAELFEARRPKDASEISKIDGIVDFGPSVRGKRCVLISDPQTKITEEHLIPIGKHVIVFKGDLVKKGQQLTEGPMDPHEILEVCGPQELQEHLVSEVQEVYRLQGVTINDKHIEIIVRQMLRKVRITEAGDTSFLWGEQVDKLEFEAENEAVEKKGGKPAEASPVLLGITKASLETDSFLSAASFQDTTRVLTEAATRSKIDNLRGFKENVIMGHIIPAGTGFERHRKASLRPMVEIPPDEPVEAVPVEAENPLLG
jgi:DNA-directed RNA polymerase subunit beta'